MPLFAFTSAKWVLGLTQVVGYNDLQAVKISGSAAQGFSSGQAMAEMERLAGELPAGFGFEWTGHSLQEKTSGGRAPILLGLSLICVFFRLDALYGSWSIPVAVMLVVPLGAIVTSFAFILGVVPLAFATGASSASQRAIGTGVLGGMISATVLAVLLVPTFFVVVLRLFQRRRTTGTDRPQAAELSAASRTA